MQFNKNSHGNIELRDDRALAPFSHVHTCACKTRVSQV